MELKFLSIFAIIAITFHVLGVEGIEISRTTASITECSGQKDGNCECGDASQGFQTYTLMQDGVQRCFTVFHPLSRSGESLPVVFSPQCYGKDNLQSISMKNDNAPMPCSDEDSKDIAYIRKIFNFIESIQHNL